ncbi:MAG: hypothetical protein ACOYMI_00470 [Phycisphaerales bacterium]
MSGWIERILTIPADLAGESWTLVLRITPPMWMLVLLGLLMMGIGWFSYAGLRGGRPARLALATCRALSLGVVLLLALGPMIEWPRERIERDVVHVLLDRSTSLRVRDEIDANGVAITRDDALRTLIQQPVWNQIAKDHDIAWHAFGGGVRDMASAEALGPIESDRTLIASVLGQWLDRAGARPIGGVILVTDGRSQDAVDETTRQRLGSMSAPLIAIPLGDERGTQDRAITEIEHPQRAFPRDQVPVSVVIRNPTTDPVKVVLRERVSGVVLDERTVERDGSGRDQITLTGSRQTAGKGDWEVVLISDRADADASNDRREIQVDFMDRPLRVLFVDGWPRWEYRYLKNLLLRESGLESSVMLLSADRDFAQEGTAPLARLPANAEEFAAFDVVILGDVPGSYLDEARQKALRDMVATRGTGLLWIGGPRSTPGSWKGFSLEDTLPFTEAGDLPRWDEPVTMLPTEMATRVGLLRLGDRDEPWPAVLGADGEPWARLEWAQRVERRNLKPTVETWATVSGRDARETLPVVMSMRFGAGMVTYVATDETWRWRHGRGETLPERFWIQIIRHLARQSLRADQNAPAIEVDPVRVAVDQPTRVVVDGLGDATLETVVVEAERSDGSEVVEIRLQPQDMGRYAGSWAPPAEGAWRIRAARGAGWTATEAMVEVRSEQPEQVDTTPDHALLQGLVSATNGRMIRAQDASQLAAVIPSRSITVRQPIQRPLWDRWPLYALVVTLLATEWMGRRALRLA